MGNLEEHTIDNAGIVDPVEGFVRKFDGAPGFAAVRAGALEEAVVAQVDTGEDTGAPRKADAKVAVL